MKKLFPILFFIILKTFAQEVPPQYISYRAIALEGNNPILDTDIAIKLSILESDTSTTPIYAEIHHAHTDVNTGFYSLNIGDGTPDSSTLFNQINWASGNKFLKVEMDITNGNNFSQLVGTTQLLSVPYAFVAGQSLNGIETLPNIQSLREYNGEFENKFVYVICHSNFNDGGGGFFYWNSDVPNEPKFNDNDGTIINQNGNSGTGRWLRKFEGNIDVRFFGPNITDDLKIQKAIDFAYNNSDNMFTKGSTVFLPNGAYYCHKIVLKSGVRLIGESIKNTFIVNYPDDDNLPYLVEIEEGIIRNIEISDITFTTSSQNITKIKGCINFKAKPDLNGDGGLWNAIIKNVHIYNFTGTSINLEGGGENSGYKLPNQFNFFENVQLQGLGNLRSNDSMDVFAIPPVLKITGQNGQSIFTNCRIDGGEYLFKNGFNNPYKVNGINVYIGVNSGNLNNTEDVKYNSDVITFNNCTFQTGEIGFFIHFANNINIQNSWFENFERAIMIQGNNCNSSIIDGCVRSKNINIQNNKFLFSAGRFGNLPINTGSVIIVENAQANIQNNTVIDPTITENVYFVATYNNNFGVNLSNNNFDTPNLGKTLNMHQVINIENNKINIESSKLVFIKVPVNSINNRINRIESTINAGETIFIRADQGSITFYPMNPTNETSGKNIYLNGRTSLTLNNGQAATFIKIDNIVGNEPATYQLVSISN